MDSSPDPFSPDREGEQILHQRNFEQDLKEYFI